MESTDNQLVRRINNGDQEAFSIIVERYGTSIYNLMYRYSGSAEEAADLTQDVFCKTYEKLNTYRERQRFFSWIYTLALNHARDWSRKRQSDGRKIAHLVNVAAVELHGGTSRLEADQDIDELEQALSQLPEDNREMVMLKYRHELTIKELTEIFNLSESAVKMRLHRSLAELRKILG